MQHFPGQIRRCVQIVCLRAIACSLIVAVTIQCNTQQPSGNLRTMTPPDWSQVKGPRALFLAPDNVHKPLYLVHDPLRGTEIPLENGWKVYRFDETGVLRVRWFEEARLPNYWLRALAADGHEISARKSRFDYGGTVNLAVSSWALTEYGVSFLMDYPNWRQPLTVQLSLRGFEGLERTPDQQALIDADPFFSPSRGSKVATYPLPRFASDSTPTPKFIVPDGFTGPVYLITDPKRGSPPKRDGDVEIYAFPAEGILRVQLTEEQSRNPAWPLVFERGGTQLWLRTVSYKNVGFKHLPIAAFVVCRTEEEVPDYEGRESMTAYDQLVERGVTELSWD